MKKLFLLFIVILVQISLQSTNLPGYLSYVDPLPGSKYVNAGSTIIIKPDSKFSVTEFSKEIKIKISGSISGLHECKIEFSDDHSTIIYKPAVKFILGETVNVSFHENTGYNKNFHKFSYIFKVSNEDLNSVYLPFNGQNFLKSELNSNEAGKNGINDPEPLDANGLPKITINNSTEPSAGYIFISNLVFSTTIPNTPYLLILGNNVQPYFSRPINSSCLDFKIQPNGYLTYFHGINGKYYELDSTYNMIDSFYCGNNFSTDTHELRVLVNGHALLLSYDTELVNMQPIVPGGNPGARVAGLIVQEIDRNKNVVFQWRSWDYFQITDATHEDLTAPRIDYVHGNAVDLDNDGNLLISSRHMDEITKINRNTGAIIWRLGGKNNQFNFINDPIRFSHQHAIRRIANGNVVLFDNGNFHSPAFSRAIEYNLDEINKTATLIWQYRNTPDVYGPAMGYVQRLDNGNTVIGWGAANTSVTEVKYDGTKVFEISLPNQEFSYRAFRFDWKEKKFIPTSYKLNQNYPNPFNPSTSIVFDILKESNVHLKVYDVLGRQVTELINSNLQPGRYTSVWNAQGYASGVYFYKIIAGDYIESKKMILVK